MLLFEVGYMEIQGMATVILFGFIFYLMTEFRMLKTEIMTKQPAPASNQLPLQAYERLSLFTDRVTLKNLVSRMHTMSLTVAELQAGMIETIKNEYEHNITQQIYVNPEVWKAVTKMKEQNIYIINHLAATLPAQANAMELSKMILEYSMKANAELGPIVLDAIQFEVKKLI
ncbi:MAG: hypothetical protein ABIN01_08115 [Ferruginibacter sp.]